MGALYGNTQLTGKEQFFEDVIVSKTDLEGKWPAPLSCTTF
jgi:hypothetical protein